MGQKRIVTSRQETTSATSWYKYLKTKPEYVCFFFFCKTYYWLSRDLFGFKRCRTRHGRRGLTDWPQILRHLSASVWYQSIYRRIFLFAIVVNQCAWRKLSWSNNIQKKSRVLTIFNIGRWLWWNVVDMSHEPAVKHLTALSVLYQWRGSLRSIVSGVSCLLCWHNGANTNTCFMQYTQQWLLVTSYLAK